MRKLRTLPEASALQAIREEYGLDDAHLAVEQDLAAFYRAALDVLRHAKVERARLRGKDWLAAVVIVLLVAATALPGGIPILLVGDPVLALRLANLLQVGLLFAVGYHWARYSGANPWRTGAAIVGFAVALVGISIALGG
jgi:VIT1/CCC1 family predicted Fe2+/Mn2+ transporter